VAAVSGQLSAFLDEEARLLGGVWVRRRVNFNDKIMDEDMRIDPWRAKQLGDNLANVVQRIQSVNKSNRPVRTDHMSPMLAWT